MPLKIYPIGKIISDNPFLVSGIRAPSPSDSIIQYILVFLSMDDEQEVYKLWRVRKTVMQVSYIILLIYVFS